MKGGYIYDLILIQLMKSDSIHNLIINAKCIGDNLL